MQNQIPYRYPLVAFEDAASAPEVAFFFVPGNKSKLNTIMNITNQFDVKAGYVSPRIKIAAMRVRSNILTVSQDGQYGSIQGSAGTDASYDPYNEDNDL